MALTRKKKQNDFEKLFDLDPAEKEKVQEQKTLSPEEAEKRRKRKSLFRKILVIGLPLIIVIVAAVLIICNRINNSGYRLQIKNTLNLVLEEDANGICENLSGLSYHGMTYDEYLIARYRTVDSYVESFADKLKTESGTIESTKIKIINSEKLNSEEIADLISSSVPEGTEPTVKADDIDEVRRVDIKLTVNGSKFVTTYYVYNVYVVNEKGQWKTYINIDQLVCEQISQEFPK